MNKQLQKYLQRRAAQGPWTLSTAAQQKFKAAIVIPALAESESLPKTLASLTTNPAEYLQQTLIIIVVNNRRDVTTEQLSDNQTTLDGLQSNPYPQLKLAWIDASSPGLELQPKEGVGLARKIGFDLALSHLNWSTKPLFISLDADTLADENYLPAIFSHFEKSENRGATIPFHHQPGANRQQEIAIRYYELYLRSYLFGLQQVGSPYAYHSIGSAFACRVEAYIAAGGMNRRLAAEDFYFLQQLAKTAGVEMLRGTVVQPSPRLSARVPFGTGKAVQGQVEEDAQLFQFSSAAAFSVLERWLRLVAEGLQQPAENLVRAAATLSPLLHQFLLELNFSVVWTRLQGNHSNAQKRLQAFHGWFDGLRTRQLLARLDAGQDTETTELVAELLDWGGYPGVSGPAEQLALLERLQNAG